MEKQKIAVLGCLISGILLVLTGTAYSAFTANINSNNQELLLGDIYLRFKDNNQIELNNLLPSNTYDSTKYFEFTIDGKNTYTKEDIWYEIVLSHGSNHVTRTERIRDDLLKFTLIEIKEGVETIVVDSKSYSDLNNTRIWVNTIDSETNEEIEIKYRLYMWVSDDILIGNISGADYDATTWNNQIYASIKVGVNGDLVVKELK